MKRLYEYECFDESSDKVFVRVYASSLEEANRSVANTIVKTRYNLKAIVEVPDESWKEDMANSFKKMADQIDTYNEGFEKLINDLNKLKKGLVEGCIKEELRRKK
jgi:soluble cytochrome b562